MIEKKQRQMTLLKLTMILTALAGASVLLFWCYVNYMVGPMVTAEGELLDSLTGLDVIVIASALGFAYCIINFSRLRELDKSGLLQKSLSQFETKTSQFLYGAEGVLIANAFTFIFWYTYTNITHLTQYLAADDSFQDFTGLNRIWLGLMLAAAIISAVNLAAAKMLNQREKGSRRK